MNFPQKPKSIFSNNKQRKYPVRKWQVMLNLMAQPENNFEYWSQVLPSLVYYEINSSRITKDIETICMKLSCGFIIKFERKSSQYIPSAIKKLVANYIFETPCAFEQAVCKWKRKYWDIEKKEHRMKTKEFFKSYYGHVMVSEWENKLEAMMMRKKGMMRK